MHRLTLHAIDPSNHPLLLTNCAISGTPNSMMSRSAMAMFTMNKFVSDFLIFLLNKTTRMTRQLPNIPMKQIMKNVMDRKAMLTSPVGSRVGENPNVLLLGVQLKEGTPESVAFASATVPMSV